MRDGTDGTVEPVSRDKILGANGAREKIVIPVNLTTSRLGNHTRLIHTLLKWFVFVFAVVCLFALFIY